MPIAKAFSPAHITGLFEAYSHRNPLLSGSRGAGVSLSKGVVTTVKAEKSTKWDRKVLVNGMPSRADVSNTVIDQFIPLASFPHDILVEHEVAVPIGAGYGSSGAGALSLALALNEALDVGLTRTGVGQLAHLAEVKCKTGLGTVIAEDVGGIEIRRRPGAPGIGIVSKMEPRKGDKVVSIFLAPLPTRRYLTTKRLVERINFIGGSLLADLSLNSSIPAFLKMSRQFADKVDLYSPRVRQLLAKLDGLEGSLFSMNIFGEAVFTIASAEDEKWLADKLANIPFQKIVANVDLKGAHVLD